MSKVFVLDALQQPLTPVHPGRARLLLTAGKASVFRNYPFTIILKRQVEHPAPAPLRLKIDPGAKTTGLALVEDASGEVVWAAELTHRGTEIKKALDTRRAVRRGRRYRRTRYRPARWANRRRKAGWLPPSLFSRVGNILTWVMRIRRSAHVTALSQELVRFDLQKLEHPEITGLQYQQGTLFGYEIREYVLEKWNRKCAYCGATEVPLQLEHIQSRARGGSDRVSNLCLACEPCNRAKGTQDIRAFLAHDPARLERILRQAKAPLKDAAAVNTTRWSLFERLQATGLPVEIGSGGRTKYNRARLVLPKTHWLDAAAVGASTPERLHTAGVVPLLISATGRGHRRLCNFNALGFPVSHRQRHKRSFGFQTGDVVRAVVPERFACRGTHVGRVAVRARGSFNIMTKQGKITDVPHRFCQLIERSNGYSYQTGERYAVPPPKQPIRNSHSSPASKDRSSPTRFLWQRYFYEGAAGSLPYFVYTPVNYHIGTAVPLILMLHGCTQTAADLAASTRMNRLADQYQFIVVYPQQVKASNRYFCWNWFEPANQSRGSGEPALLAGIVQSMKQNTSLWTVDEQRVYAAGMSAGAAMSVILGATYPDIFAAIGVHSGLEYQAATTSKGVLKVSQRGGPDPQQQGLLAYKAMGDYARAIPTIVFQGVNDYIVSPINGDQVIQQWMRTDLLASGGTYDATYHSPSTMKSGKVPDGRTYSIYTWSDSNGNELQEYWKVNGLGHAWSGGSKGVAYSDPQGPDASLAMYMFFMKHPMRGEVVEERGVSFWSNLRHKLSALLDFGGE